MMLIGGKNKLNTMTRNSFENIFFNKFELKFVCVINVMNLEMNLILVVKVYYKQKISF